MSSRTWPYAFPRPNRSCRPIAPRIDNVRVTGTMRFRENVAAQCRRRGQSDQRQPLDHQPKRRDRPVHERPAVRVQAQLRRRRGQPNRADHRRHRIAVYRQQPALHRRGDDPRRFNHRCSTAATSAPRPTRRRSAASPATPRSGTARSAASTARSSTGRASGERSATPSTLETWLGRFGANPQPNCMADCYPVQFGPFGLLMNDTGATWSDSTADTRRERRRRPAGRPASARRVGPAGPGPDRARAGGHRQYHRRARRARAERRVHLRRRRLRLRRQHPGQLLDPARPLLRGQRRSRPRTTPPGPGASATPRSGTSTGRAAAR